MDNAYELVIRLFSKIPFLQYNFVAQEKPIAVEKQIESKIDSSLLKYHRLICNGCLDINEYLKVSSIPEDDETIESEIKQRLKKGE